MNHDIPKLTAQVNAENKVNTLVNRVAPTLLARFQPLVGLQLYKVDGSPMKKYADILNNIEGAWRDGRSTYSLCYEFKADVQDHRGHSVYAKHMLYVGSLQNGILADIDNLTKFTPLRTNYTVDEVIAHREEYARLKRLADNAHSALYPFGEY